MKLHYYPETDSLYVELKAGPGVETREVSAGINVDLDAEGNAVGFDIDQASRKLDLGTLETEALRVRRLVPACTPQPSRRRGDTLNQCARKSCA